MTGRSVFIGISGGFAIWGSALIMAYGVHAIGCAFGWPVGATRAALAAILLAHAAAVVVLWRHQPAADGALVSVVRWTLAAALLAIVVTFAPGLVLTACV